MKNPVGERQSATDIMAHLLLNRRQLLDEQAYTDSHHRHIRELCSILLWKHSEAFGKYDGCRYWTEEAVKSRNTHGHVVTNRNAYGDDALRHEHLFPREQLIDRLFGLAHPTVEEVRSLVDRLNIGVVVTVAEHHRLPPQGVDADPWERYRAVGVSWRAMEARDE